MPELENLKSFNHNCRVWAKLNETGRKSYQNYYGKPPKVDQYGFTYFTSFWQFLEAMCEAINTGQIYLEDGQFYIASEDVKAANQLCE